jgi:hypothetical protein
MSYQQPPAGTPPQPPAPPGGMPPAAPVPQAQPPVAPPAAAAAAPGPQPPPPAPRRSTAGLVAALLGTAALVLLVVAVLGHTWLRPENTPDEVSGGFGLWSLVTEGPAESIDVPLSDLVTATPGDAEAMAKTGMFAYGSMAFFVLNWLVIAFLALGTLIGWLRWAGARPAGVPFALTLIPSIVGVVGFLGWFGISVLLAETLDGMDIGGMVFLWVTGMVAALVSAILYAKVRSSAAFGAGFRGTGGMMPPGAGTVGPQMLPPGGGVIQNPADSLGPRPQG